MIKKTRKTFATLECILSRYVKIWALPITSFWVKLFVTDLGFKDRTFFMVSGFYYNTEDCPFMTITNLANSEFANHLYVTFNQLFDLPTMDV